MFFKGVTERAEIQREALKSDGEVAGLATEMVAGHEVTRLFASSERLADKMDAAFGQSNSHWFRHFKAQHVNQQSLSAFFALSMLMLLSFAAYQVAEGWLSPGDFILMNAYLIQVVAPVERLSFASRELIQGFGNIERLSEILDERSEQELNSGFEQLSGNGPLDLVVDGVWFGFAPGEVILRDVSFHLARGRTIAIVGRSGSGKSTLMRLICCVFRPDKGQIRVNGIPSIELDIASLRRAIAVVPQDTFLFNDSIIENIRIARPEASMADVVQAGKRARLDDLVSSLPDGWHTIVGERGLRLSGGERQRVAIARAMLRRPRLLILDEGTSALEFRDRTVDRHRPVFFIGRDECNCYYASTVYGSPCR